MTNFHFGKYLLLIITLTSLFVPVTVSGEQFPEKLYLPKLNNIPTQHSIMPNLTIILGINTVHLERTTLTQILRLAEGGTILSTGDASESDHSICFSIVSADHHAQNIWFSSGELDIAANVVDSMSASESTALGTIVPPCPRMPAKLLPVSIGGSVWLGSSQDELVNWLGPPGSRRRRWWLYNYEGTPDAKGFVTTELVAARIAHGRVNALLVSRSTSN